MTKQEEIREGVAECFYYFHGWDGKTKWEDVSTEDREVYYDFADKIIEWEHSQGVVIKVNTAEPPIFFSKEIIVDSKQLAMVVEKVRDTYDRVGYVAVESLVKEV